MVYELITRIQDVIFPPTCVLCAGAGMPGGIDICQSCAEELPPNRHACIQCGEQLPGAVQQVCGACLQKPPRYHSTHCAFRYGYPIDHLIRGLKYSGRLACARVLGHLLCKSLFATSRSDWPQMLIPVPLAAERFRERGFNQAVELSKHLEHRLRVPMSVGVLERTRATQEQAGLDRLGRRRNVRGAFALRRPLTVQHVAIVDDVITTGSTANEIARVLKRAGATRIEVWAVARASR